MSDTGTDAPTEELDTEPAPSETDPSAALKAELEKWKHQARENEKRAKANAQAAKELEEFRKAQMTETEKAIAEAAARTRSEVVAELSSKIVAADIRAALTGVVPDPAAIIEDLNLAKYVTESGDVDAKAVAALREKYLALGASSKDVAPKVPTGPRGAGGQITRESLKSMSPEAISAARRAGQLDHLMQG